MGAETRSGDDGLEESVSCNNCAIETRWRDQRSEKRLYGHGSVGSHSDGNTIGLLDKKDLRSGRDRTGAYRDRARLRLRNG